MAYRETFYGDDAQSHSPTYKDATTSKVSVPARLPWGSDIVKELKTAAMPSPTYNWWLRQCEKRAKGFRNEIDIAEMRAAIKGTRNKFHGVVMAHPREFAIVEQDNGKFDFDALMTLYKNHASKQLPDVVIKSS